MLIPVYKNKFAKDIKRLKKRGKDLKKLRSVANELISGKALDKKYLNHPLRGEYTECNECHIEPDWLLIYKIENPRSLLYVLAPIPIFLSNNIA